MPIPNVKTIMAKMKAILFDLDGVLYVEDKVINEAPATIARLKERGVICRFTTNTTTIPLGSIHKKLLSLGFDVEKEEIVSPPIAARIYLERKGRPSCHLFLNEEVIADFEGFDTTAEKPEVVVLGDIGTKWDYKTVDQAFRMIMNGAEFVALHKGKFWQRKDGLHIDIGCFVAGLEYVTRKNALIIGKPSGAFFDMAIHGIDAEKERIAVIGDDIDSDVGGAQDFGCFGILVKTGKYREEYCRDSLVKPDLILDSVDGLRAYY